MESSKKGAVRLIPCADYDIEGLQRGCTLKRTAYLRTLLPLSVASRGRRATAWT